MLEQRAREAASISRKRQQLDIAMWTLLNIRPCQGLYGNVAACLLLDPGGVGTVRSLLGEEVDDNDWSAALTFFPRMLIV